jgi:alcohol dehydrogenase class IV
MMLGSLEAGLAFSNASLGAVHAMAHSLSGLPSPLSRGFEQASSWDSPAWNLESVVRQ